MMRFGFALLTLIVSLLGSSVSGQPNVASADPQAVWAMLHDVLPTEVLAAIGAPQGRAVSPTSSLTPLPGESSTSREGEMIGIDAEADAESGEVIKPPLPIIVRGANLKHVPLKRLRAVDVPTLQNEDAQAAQFNKAMRFGVGRNLLAEMDDGAWLRVNDHGGDGGGGWLWVMDVQCDGALALRVHVLNMFLPRGATLIAYAAPALNPQNAVQGIVGPYEYAGPFDDGDLWLPTIRSQRVRIECWLPVADAHIAEPVEAAAATGPDARHDQPPAQPLFALDRVQHIYRDPLQELNDEDGNANGPGSDEGIAGSPLVVPCHNQVACYPQWLNTANAVGGIGLIANDSIFCSGQLIRTLIDDRTPYFLTAHHCLSSNLEARSCEVYWRYQSPTCGGVAPYIGSVPQSNVCSLVATDPNTDFTLLMIEGPLPSNARWADWDNIDAANGTDVVCIHHPQGKQKRISFGVKQTPATCGGALTHLRVDWQLGVTQPGSSGSGVFRADNGKLIGQLHCGSSGCGNITSDSFGSFWVTYGLISDLLAAGSDDGFEDNDTCAVAELIGEGVYNNRIVKSLDTDWYRINVPAGQALTATANFKHAWGDIDMRLYSTCGGPAIHVSQSSSNSETVSFLNTTGQTQGVRLRVFIVNDVRNKYKLTVDISNP